LAERTVREVGTEPAAWTERAFRLAVARSPSAAEREILVASLARFQQQFAADPDAAKKYLASGESPRDASLDPIQHAAFMAVANLLLNLDEAQTKE